MYACEVHIHEVHAHEEYAREVGSSLGTVHGRFHFSPTIYTPASGSKPGQLEDLLNDKDYKNSEEVQLVTNGKGGFWCRFVARKNGFSRNISSERPISILESG